MNNEFIERVAMLIYQFAKLIADKDIKERWHNLDNREIWFDCAEEVVALVLEERGRKDESYQ